MKAALFVPGLCLNLTQNPQHLLAQYQDRLDSKLAPVDTVLRDWRWADQRLWAQFHVCKAIKNQWGAGVVNSVRSGPERLKYALPDSKKFLTDPASKWIEGASFLQPLAEGQAENDLRGLYARPFLLERLEDDSFAVNEVIPAGEITDESLWQLSIELYLLRHAGTNVTKAKLWREVDRNQYEPVDVTNEVEAQIAAAQAHVQLVSAQLMALPALELPDTLKSMTDYPVSALLDTDVKGGPNYYAKYNLVDRLVELGVLDMRLIPDAEQMAREFPKHMLPISVQQIAAHKMGQGYINKDGLREELAQLQWPIQSMDFETMIKTPSGEEQVPYQFASRTVNRDGSVVAHDQFLPEHSGDPRLDFARALVASLKREGGKGSLIVYHADFEISRIQETAAYLRKQGQESLADELLSVIPRVVDLLVLLRKHVYLPKFHGSFSLKETYPAIVNIPAEEAYLALPIKNGLEAAGKIVELMDLFDQLDKTADANHQNTLREKIDELRRNLFEYCGLDVKGPLEMLFKLMDALND